MQQSGTYRRLYDMQFSDDAVLRAAGERGCDEPGGNCVSADLFDDRLCQRRGGSRDENGLAFTLTIKSVNHRFLDLQLRLPSYCDGLEMQMRRMLKERLQRGHVDVTLQVERRANAQIQLNAGLAGALTCRLSRGAAQHGLASEPDLNAMLRIPGVMSAESSG